MFNVSADCRVPAYLLVPKGEGPFPAIIFFHGAPGGRGMEQLVGWSRGATGGPVWERFLQAPIALVLALLCFVVARGGFPLET